jgi:hypothetical protein
VESYRIKPSYSVEEGSLFKTDQDSHPHQWRPFHPYSRGFVSYSGNESGSLSTR